MQTPSSPVRRRLLKITACAVAGVSTGEVLAATNSIANSATGEYSTETLNTHHFSAFALGARVTLAIVHSDKNAASEIAALAFTEIERLERIFSLYVKNSSVALLNSAGRIEHPPAELLSVFSHATGVWNATAGAFDPTVQPHWSQRLDPANSPVTFSWRDVRYSTSTIEFSHPDMAITLNGIAQGYISEQVAILLRKQGLENVLVNVGEIIAVGKRSNGDPWQVGLAERQSDSAQYTLALTDMAVATSAPLSHISDATVAAGHIIDPVTGRACLSPWHWLSVVHPSAAVADGLSTGLVMKSGVGIKKAISFYPQAEVLATDHKGGQYWFNHHS